MNHLFPGIFVDHGREKELDNRTIQLFQTCEDVDVYKNLILLNEEGSIVLIDQVVTGEGYRIQLNKL